MARVQELTVDLDGNAKAAVLRMLSSSHWLKHTK